MDMDVGATFGVSRQRSSRQKWHSLRLSPRPFAGMVGRSLFCAPLTSPSWCPAVLAAPARSHSISSKLHLPSYLSTPQTTRNLYTSTTNPRIPASEVCTMAEAQATAPAIDETPISPVREGIQRRNSLEKHLTHRPDAQDLKNRNILLDTNAAP